VTGASVVPVAGDLLMKPLAMILCGALAREVVAIVRSRGWPVDLHGISAREHMTPQTIGPLVEARLREILPSYQRVIVVYGDCGTRGALDAVLAAYNIPRIIGPHCYEMYGGAAHDAQMAEQPGTFFLTDYLLRGFDGLIWKGLGLDRHPELRDDYFRNYTRIVYQVQIEQPELILRAHAVAGRLGLPLEIHHTGFGGLETRLSELVEVIHRPEYEPRRTLLNHDNVSDPVLARPSVTSPRTRRTRARQRPAQPQVSRGD
jgi:Protein of unknown function (DUF1638)